MSVTADRRTSQDLFRGRTGLEAVRWALHGEGPRRAIRAAVAAALEPGATLGPCRVVRSKYKPGRKLKVHLEASVISGTGTHRRQMVVTWGAPAFSAGSGPAVSELEVAAVSSGVAAPFARLTAEVPSLGVSILIWPMDPALPQLLDLVDPGYVAAFLAPLVGREPHAGERWRVETERYRPGERHVLRYSDGTQGGSVFAKLGRGQDVGREFRLAARVADRLAGAGERSRGARPLAVLEHERAILFQELDGVPLSRLLQRRDRSSDTWLTVAGRLLRTLHDPPPLSGDELGLRAFEDEIVRARRASEHVRALLPPAGRVIDGILSRAARSMQSLPSEPPTFTHGDAKADHLWTSRNALTLMDFGTCAAADPALDIGKLLADVAWWGQGPNGNPRAGDDVRRAETALLAGYGPAGKQRRQRALAWASVLFVTIIGHRVPLSDPRWAERTTALLDSANVFLDGSLGDWIPSPSSPTT